MPSLLATCRLQHSKRSVWSGLGLWGLLCLFALLLGLPILTQAQAQEQDPLLSQAQSQAQPETQTQTQTQTQTRTEQSTKQSTQEVQSKQQDKTVQKAATGQAVQPPQTVAPARAISLAPHITEILFAA